MGAVFTTRRARPATPRWARSPYASGGRVAPMPSEETRSTVVQAREIIRRLASIPVRLSDALARSDEDQIRAPASEGEWSAADILAHLRASDAIVAPRAYMILAREDPPLTAFDER